MVEKQKIIISNSDKVYDIANYQQKKTDSDSQAASSSTSGSGATTGSPMMDPGDGDRDNKRKENPKKQESKVWKELKNYNKDIKTNGLSGEKTEYYQWDYTHNDVEVYNSNGRHLGSMDPTTGKMYKPAVPGRTIQL